MKTDTRWFLCEGCRRLTSTGLCGCSKPSPVEVEVRVVSKAPVQADSKDSA